MNMVMKAKTQPESISAAEFKAKCLELMDSVAATGKSVTVTKRGRPVAMLAPIRARQAPAAGFAKEKLRIIGDLMSPIDAVWDADS